MESLHRLSAEHRQIERALARLDLCLASPQAEELEALLTFFVRFVDGSHHAREEEVIFKALAQVGGEGTLDILARATREHEQAADYLRTAQDAFIAWKRGQNGGEERLKRSLDEFCQLLRAHLNQEDRVLFPLFRRLVPEAWDQRLLEELDNQERRRWGPGELERVTAVLAQSRKEATMVIRSRKDPAFLDARTLAGDNDAPGENAPAEVGGPIYDDGRHRAIWLQDFGRGLQVHANQFLIVDGDEAMILDPGGPKVYPQVYAATQTHLGSARLRYVFLSHQDPDIGTSLNAWLMDTEADAYCSRLWVRFLPHFGIDRLLEERLKGIPDQGMWLTLGATQLLLLPAHFLHSCGNFQVYDPVSKVLFSGDLGASLGVEETEVSNFERHAEVMRGFHQRYMASNKALKAWVRMVRALDIEVIAPQHGAIFRGKKMVRQFLDWCEDLPCGVDVLEDLFQIPPRVS